MQHGDCPQSFLMKEIGAVYASFLVGCTLSSKYETWEKVSDTDTDYCIVLLLKDYILEAPWML
jgi:hypothetical protein